MADILAKFPLEGQKSSWQSQLKASALSVAELCKALDLELSALPECLKAAEDFALRVPPHFLSLIERGNLADPLLLQILPSAQEIQLSPGYSADPLSEVGSDVPGLLHKYRSRVLLIATGACAINCRYCFRRHFPYQENRFGRKDLERIVAYIAAHPEVNEVILSGGDPLAAPDSHLALIHASLSALPQLKRLRIHTRFPIVIPDRLTDELIALLSHPRFHTIVVFHANHARELSPLFEQKLAALAASRVTLLNQSVLLKNVNDHAETLAALSERLAELRIQPYYLNVLDKVQGAAHFYVSDDEARQLMRQLLGKLPGFLVPKLTRELAQFDSKVPLDLQILTE